MGNVNIEGNIISDIYLGEVGIESVYVGDVLVFLKDLLIEVWKFTGHTRWVDSVAVDSSGNVYSGSNDKTVRKISSEGQEVWQFTGHTSQVGSVAVDNDGNVYSGSNDKTVRKISSEGQEIWQYKHKDSVTCLIVDIDNNIFAGGVNRTEKISEDGELLKIIYYGTLSIAIDNDKYIYIGDVDTDSIIKISSEGQKVWKFTGHTNNVNSVAVDSSGNVYSGSLDKTVIKISSEGQEVWKFTGHTNNVNSVAVDSSGNVYSGSDDYTVRKISSEGSEIWKFKGTSQVSSVAVNNDGNVYSGDWDNIVRKIKQL